MSKAGMRLLGCLMLAALIGTAAWGASCEDPTPLEVASSSVEGDTLAVGIHNPTQDPISGYILGTVQAGGHSIQFEGFVTVPGLSTETYEIVFQRPINVVVSVSTCGGHGVSDNSDPIVQVHPTKQE